jgi:hypothetical protein
LKFNFSDTLVSILIETFSLITTNNGDGHQWATLTQNEAKKNDTINHADIRSRNGIT